MKLRELREAAGLTLQNVAEIRGTSAQYINKLEKLAENRETEPTLAMTETARLYIKYINKKIAELEDLQQAEWIKELKE